MAFEFLGGSVHCGRPWSPYGVEVALVDCPDHALTGGKGAILEGFLSGDLDGHDPVGWPTFKDWPAPHSLTHEGTYYKWMERSWRSGQRVLVNLLVENNKLCELYPLKRNPCNDMKSIRLQAEDMRKLERYVDAQSGGPGKGWYRIVTSPQQARTVINQGKLAVVMGIETSIPFGCTTKLGIPACTAASIDRQLDEMKALGVSQMELVNKFDNALAGVAGDEGSTGALVNTANFLETGSFWRMQTCNPQDPEVHDKDQTLVPELPAQDALFGAIVKLNAPLAPLPVYPKPHHCNATGLTDLGEHLIRGMAERHMIFDPDHMSVKARKRALEVTESMGYPAVISSHSWSTPDAYPRILDAKGFITPYAGDSSGFVAKWRQVKGWANPATYWGIGFGADINGLGAQGEPRAGAADNPVTYPFTTLGGVTVDKQVSGAARLRHQQGRRLPLRALPGLDRGPAQAGRRRHRQGHGPRPGGVPPDVGARLRHRVQRVLLTRAEARTGRLHQPEAGVDDLAGAHPSGPAGSSAGQHVLLLLDGRRRQREVHRQRQA